MGEKALVPAAEIVFPDLVQPETLPVPPAAAPADPIPPAAAAVLQPAEGFLQKAHLFPPRVDLFHRVGVEIAQPVVVQHNKKEKRAALKSALTSRVEENKFIVVDELKFDEIKTKNFQNVLNNLNVNKALVVLEDGNTNVEISAKNIPDVKTARTNTINVYDVLKYNTVIATKAAVAAIEEVYA